MQLSTAFSQSIFQVEHQILMDEINVKSVILRVYLHNETKIELRLNRNKNPQRWIGKNVQVSPD